MQPNSEMNMPEWVAHYLSTGHAVYMIVDRTHDTDPVAHFARIEGEGGRPMYDKSIHSDGEEYGPWLLPIQKDKISHFNHIINSGVVVATKLSLAETVEHFNSLRSVNMEGLSINFPFYKPSFIAPVIERMEEGDRAQFLNQHHFGVMADTWSTYVAPIKKGHVIEHEESWWNYRPQPQAEQSENLPLIHINLDTWLWKRFPEHMDEKILNGVDTDLVIHSHLYSNQTPLLDRVVSAAAEILLGKESLSFPYITAIFERHKDDAIQLGLMSLAQHVTPRGY